MSIPIYQVDAFSSKVFGGNPAAVCLLDAWPDDEQLQRMAAEHNLSETAFIWESMSPDEPIKLRWFTPTQEVDLCGHATLAAACVLFDRGTISGDTVVFESRSGPLSVLKAGEMLVLDFPAMPPNRCESPDGLLRALGVEGDAAEVFKARDYLVVLESETALRELAPDMQALAAFDWVIATALSESGHCLSRFFAPGAGVPEDPVTGSAHCTLVPFWCERLGKNTLKAWQLSPRGGELFCNLVDDRVHIAGHAVIYSQGVIRGL